MKIENKANKAGYKKTLFILGITAAVVILLFSLRPDAQSLSLYGTYRLNIDRSNLYARLANQDIYLEVKKDQTIAYSQTVNEKMAFHHEGEYTLDEKTNTLNINWKTGKLPQQLTIEKLDTAYIIRVGKDIYKKEGQ